MLNNHQTIRNRHSNRISDFSDSELLKEIVINLELQNDRLDKLEKIRINTSNIVWILVIPLILAALTSIFWLITVTSYISAI